MKIKPIAAIVTITVLATFSTAQASTPPEETPPVEEQTTEVTTTVEVVTASESPPPQETSTEAVTTEESTTSAAPEAGTTIVVEIAASAPIVATTNAQVSQDQAVVITATVVADANTGGNTIVDSAPGSQLPADIGTGDATAIGSNDENIINQAAEIVLVDDAQADVVQVALILNIGVGLANSGLNVVGSAPGSGVSGGISTGSATAQGLDIAQYITQAAREEGDENTDASANQGAISIWLGLATANSGTNAITGTGVGGSGGSVAAGGASATGNDSLTSIDQYAAIFGSGTSQTNVTQNATVLNIGFAVANSGLNDIAGVAGGLLTASDDDDDALSQQLFAMLLPALLQSYGYGPASGSINSGNATAVGNESDTFIHQVALAASSGDGVVDIVQQVLVANMGAAGANTGGNTLGGGNVALLDEESANAVVTMAAFLAELLSMVHQGAASTNLQAASLGIEIPFQGLILTLDGSFEGLDFGLSEGGAQASMRQVSIVVSLGVAQANTGGNQTQTEINQGGEVNELVVGDGIALAVLPTADNAIGTGDAGAGNQQVVVVCQRINADDVACLEPPTTTIPAGPTTTATGATTTTVDPTTPSGPTGTTTPTPTTSGQGPSRSGGPAPFAPGLNPQTPYVPQGMLPATGNDPTLLGVALLIFSAGAVLVFATRRKTS